MQQELEILERQVFIAARPEIIFPYFVDPARMMQWMGIGATLDPRPGGIYRVNVNGRDILRGTYLEVMPHSRIVFTWGIEGDGSPLPPGSSTVEVTFIAESEGTTVRLKHHGLPNAFVDAHMKGWIHYLERLNIVSEGRDPGLDSYMVSDEGDKREGK